MTQTNYLSRGDLYRAACAGRPLPDNFAESMRRWLIREATDERLLGGGVRTDRFTTSLRAAVRLAEEWRGLAETSSRRREAEEAADKDEYLLGMVDGQNHQADYCGGMLLRHLAQELYRDFVPEGERVL